MNITFLASLLLTPRTAVPAIDEAERAQTINALSSALKEDYFFPDLAVKVDATLHEKLKAGGYATYTEGAAFAKVLTDDVNAICHDAHLRIRYSESVLPVRVKRNEPTAQEIADAKKQARLVNCGFEKVERLPGNIGYIDFRFFGDPELAAGPIRAAMDFVSNTDALIFDIRQNGGGDPATVRLLCSYLFDSKPVHLNDIYTNRGKNKEEFWTLKSVPGSRYLNKDIYVLTSPRSGSGAEEFAYDLQNLHRATIIGESTWGGANPGEVERLNDHFSAFIPNGRAENPYTKKNWEGTGVQPDIRVKQEDALHQAHNIALQKLIEKATTSEDKERLHRALESVKG